MDSIINVEKIVNTIGMPYSIMGDRLRVCINVRPIEEADEHSLIWISPKNKQKQHLAETSLASVIVCDESIFVKNLLTKKTFIIVENPRLAFLRILKEFFVSKPATGIHPTAFVHPQAEIGKECYIGPFCYIGKSKIGNNCQIMGHVFIYDQVKIGDNVIIHAGSVIGADGFGYQRNNAGKLEKFPHIGGVVIEDDVEIQALCTVDRATLGSTIIGKGTKLDDHIHVGHNVVIGSNSLITACVMIAGSATIGDAVWIGPNSSISDGVSIGNNAFITIGSVVVKDVLEGEKVTGNFAISHDLFIRNFKKKLL